MDARALAPLLLAAACGSTSEVTRPNHLSPAEWSGGWRSLFDGESLEHWRGFKRDDAPAGWAARDGALTLVEPGCGDLITRRQFESFELRFEWRIAPRGNSGVMFHVTEDHTETYHSGPEMQVLDNALLGEGFDRLHAAGANYALHGPERDDTRPVGEWNEARIVVDGPRVEHWLNGVLQCEYELWSEEWRRLVAASKFAQWPAYGLARVGHLALQDHGSEVAYRNLFVRAL